MGGRSALNTLMSCLCFLLARGDFQRQRPGCHLISKNAIFQPKYVQDGDIIIGGIFTVKLILKERSIQGMRGSAVFCEVPCTQYYRHLLAFIFAVDEINSNPDFLPNVTLGYHALDSCGDVNKAIDNVLQILSGPSRTVPNYSCRGHGKLAGVIGDLSSKTSIQIATILSLYGYPQISYGATDLLLSNKKLYPSFFQILPNDRIQFDAIIKLLKHFGWNWVGILASDDDAGERQTRELTSMGEHHGICFEFTLKIPSKTDKRHQAIERNKLIINHSTSQVIVLTGTVSLASLYLFSKDSGDIHKKTFIIPASWNILFLSADYGTTPFDGGLVFTRPIIFNHNLHNLLENVNMLTRPNDPLLEDIYLFHFNCLTSDPFWNELMKVIHNTSYFNCTRTDRIAKLGYALYDTFRFRTTHHVYISVYAMAVALDRYQQDFSKKIGKRAEISHIPNFKKFFRRLNFKDPSGKDIFFNENGDSAFVYHIRNYVLFSNKSYLEQHVGMFKVSAPEGEQLAINKSNITWKYNSREIPRSRCSEDCPPGYRRVLHKGKHNCCFDCVPCSEGEISNTTDGESCQKCPENRWPNEKKDTCVLKPTEFLSFKDNLIALVFSTISVLMSVITSIILVIFILYRDTPIVRANNMNLSFVLLVCLILSFLCVFLFLGRPVDITCMLRQTAFGIIFSVAVSSLLAKTIMVCIAFKATKPSSRWRKCIGVKIPNYVVFICSFIQVVICICWLSISPPYQEMNIHSYPGKIIIQCNEGSVVAFYTVLGYMGFLAAVSFVVAFLARKLPDSFNEAKYITFSMLIFCNVWISFIPAYMSVMGKNTVIVEIFAILASSAGILGSIFFPKCFIILVNPSMNTKRRLLNVGF